MVRTINYLIVLILLISCNEKIQVIKCSKKVSDYPNYDYEITDKHLINGDKKNPLYSGNVLIVINQQKGSVIKMDSIYQYILTIAYSESLAKGRFFRKEEAYKVASELKLKEFSLLKIEKEIKNIEDRKVVQKYLVGCLNIEIKEKEKWVKELNSDNIITGGFKSIAPIDGKYVRKKYKI